MHVIVLEADEMKLQCVPMEPSKIPSVRRSYRRSVGVTELLAMPRRLCSLSQPRERQRRQLPCTKLSTPYTSNQLDKSASAANNKPLQLQSTRPSTRSHEAGSQSSSSAFPLPPFHTASQCVCYFNSSQSCSAYGRVCEY